MKTKIFVNGEELDIPSDITIATTLQVYDITVLNNRQGNYTNGFDIPLTAVNKRILKWPTILPVQSRTVYEKLDAILLVNGIQSNPGFLIVIDANEDTAYCTFYSGNTDFFDALGDGNLNDLNYTELEHNWDLNSVFSSKVNTNGYVYPIVELSSTTANNTLPYTDYVIKADWLRPAVFMPFILEQIGNYTGYTLIVNNAFSQRINAELILVTNKNLVHTQQWCDEQIFNAKIDAAQAFSDGDEYVIHYADITSNPALNFDGQYYTVPADGKYSFSCSFRTTASLLSPPHEVVITREDTAGIKTKLCRKFFSFGNLSGSMSTGIVELKQYDKVYVVLYAGLAGDIEDDSFAINSFSCIEIRESSINFGSTFQFEGNMPNITLKDFIKALCQRYNLLLFADVQNKIVEFIGFNTLYNNMAYALDWSDKLEYNSAQISFHTDSFNAKNTFKYLQQTDEAEFKGAGSLVIMDQTLPNKEIEINQPFAYTPMIARLNGKMVPHVKLFTFDDTDATKYELQNISPVILYHHTYMPETPLVYQYNDDTLSDSNAEPFAWFTLHDKPFNLGFDDSLINDNYIELSEILNNYKKVEALFNLSANDVFNFDFKKPIYLKQFASYFYVNRIIDYVPQKLTKVELIKL